MQTTDYKKFKIIQGNRALREFHVEYLKKSIMKDNLLYLNPILVNSDYYVFDGQHRLKVAEDLNLPIFYTINANLRRRHYHAKHSAT